MDKLLHEIPKSVKSLSVQYCAECGAIIIGFACSCPDGPKVWKLPIPEEWEEYFWMDGSVKPILMKLNCNY